MASSKEHAEIRAALERYSKEELVDLMEHLLRLYVLNEPIKLEGNLKKPDTLNELTGYSFPQVITMLKNTLDVEELEHFRVTPYSVYVNIGGVELDLNGPAPSVSAAPAAADDASDDRSADIDDDNLTPAERMDLDSKPWRSAPAKAAPAPVSKVETPAFADLFADNNKDRGFIMFDEPPAPAEEDDELPPPIAESAPGDDPKVAAAASSSNDFAKAAATRDEAPAAEPAKAPELAGDDKQIDPSNRFASLDLD